MKSDAITNQVLLLFLLMLVGLIARKCRVLNNDLNAGLSSLLLNVTVPFTIITAFNLTFSNEILSNIIIIFLGAAFAHLFAALLSSLLYLHYQQEERKILKFATIFANTGFMGLPVLESLFGKMGVFYGSIYVITFNLFLWTLGVMIFTSKKEVKILKALTNPALIAVLLGSILFFFSLKLPAPIFQTFELIGSMTTPLSMLIIGSMLADLKPKELFAGFPVYYATIARLLITPLIVALILKFGGVQEQLLRICITSTAMPAATMTAIFAEKYDGDILLASRIIIISTVFSILTIPLILTLVSII